MTRTSGNFIAFTLLFLALLAGLAWAEMHGFVSGRVTELWAKAIIEVDGPVNFRATDAFFPPLPYVLSIGLQWVVGHSTVPTPFVLAAALGALTLVMWFGNLRYMGGMSAAASYAAVALLALNPFFLRVVAEGPESIMLMFGTWLFVRGIVNLRLTGNAPDMMKVAVGLLIVSLSSSYGLLLCLGALPFMVVAARPSMLVASSVGYLIAMFYPVAAAVLSLLFVSKIFNSSLIPLLTDTPIDISPMGHVLVLMGMVPVALVVILRTAPTSRYFMPLIAGFATVLSAYALNMFFYVEADPVLAIAPLLAVVATTVRFWPPSALREPIVLVLLALGLVLSLISLRVTPAAETSAWFAAMQGQTQTEVKMTQDVAAFLATKDQIIVDIERNPEIVPAVGDISQLIVAGQTVYDWALEGGVLRAKYILVQNIPEGVAIRDRVLRRFPELMTDRLNQYSEVFNNPKWRVFERDEQ